MKFDIMLDASDENFTQQLKDALGIKEGDEVEFMTPQFKRVDGAVITYIPRTLDEFAALQTFSEETLTKLGLGIWDKDENKIQWLYPGEWYNYIPNGLQVTSICGTNEIFVKGETDNDIRFGCLAYGFTQTLRNEHGKPTKRMNNIL